MKTRGWLVVSTVAVIVAGLLVVLYFWAKQPVNSDVKIAATGQTAPTPVAVAVKVDSEYFTATLPDGFAVQSRTERISGPQLIQMTTVGSSRERSQLALTIGQLPQDGLSGIADYNYRISNQNLYNQNQFSWLPTGATAFCSSDGGETTIIWPHAALYAIVSLSGPEQTALEQTLQTFMAAWQWK